MIRMRVTPILIDNEYRVPLMLMLQRLAQIIDLGEREVGDGRREMAIEQSAQKRIQKRGGVELMLEGVRSVQMFPSEFSQPHGDAEPLPQRASHIESAP